MALPTGLVGVRTISGGSLGAFFFFFLLLLPSLISSSGSCSGRGGGGSDGKGGNSESGGGGAPSGFSRPIGGGGGGINSLSVLSLDSVFAFPSVPSPDPLGDRFPALLLWGALLESSPSLSESP